MTSPESLLITAFERAIEAVQADKVLVAFFPPAPKGRLVVVGAGKAAAAMARAAEDHYGQLEGLVITRYGHALPCQFIEVVEAAHPVPDQAGLEATQRILDLARGLGKDDLLLCLISGGGSSLLTAPAGISLARKRQLTSALLRSGASIHEMNALRKHLSAVKGGRLAEAAYPAEVCTLMISDVPGDDISVIASGPSVPDESTLAEAMETLRRYQLDIPEVEKALEEAAETPTAEHPAFARASWQVVASAQGMLTTVAEVFEKQGIKAMIISDALEGEAREAAKFHAAMVRQIRRYGQPLVAPCVLLSGGETTVTVKAEGRGGRNSEFLLALALELDGMPDVYALAADTDGIDGSEDNAGAWLTPETLAKVGRLEAKRYLSHNDSYGFFQQAGSLLEIGPTLTNVNDLRMILLTA